MSQLEIRYNERFNEALFDAAVKNKPPLFASKLVECALALCGSTVATFDYETANSSPAAKTFLSAFL